jgi:hypothetical protein
LKARLLNDEIIIDMLPSRAPGGAPDRDASLCNLIESVSLKNGKNFEHRGPEGRFGCSVTGAPKAGLRKIFGFQNEMELTGGLFRDPPGRRKDETMVNGPQISNSQPSILFWRAVIFPSRETESFCDRLRRNTSPPKGSDDFIDFGYEFFGENDVGHVVHRDRGKNRVYQFHSSSMR